MFGYKKKVDYDFDSAVESAKKELDKEGFGVLCEIDVKSTLKKKLDVEYDDYVILGACNPPFSHEALKAEKEIGLMLPCNVIVYKDDGEVFVSAIMPTKMMSIIDNPELMSVAQKVEKKLKKVVDNI